LRAFLHRFGLRIATTAMVALLIAQFGAMSHTYSHDASLDSASTPQSTADSRGSCTDCLAYAPLLAAAGTPSALLSFDRQDGGPAARVSADSLVDLSLTIAFRSRAPPHTL